MANPLIFTQPVRGGGGGVNPIVAGICVLQETFTVAELTAGAVSQVLPFGPATGLPDIPSFPPDTFGYQLYGFEIALPTAFTGGGAAACTADIGPATNTDAFVDGANIFAAVDGQAATYVLGVSPFQLMGVGTTLSLVVTSDVNVNLLTAGEMTITAIMNLATFVQPRLFT